MFAKLTSVTTCMNDYFLFRTDFVSSLQGLQGVLHAQRYEKYNISVNFGSRGVLYRRAFGKFYFDFYVPYVT
jgi:hypothetical protein